MPFDARHRLHSSDASREREREKGRKKERALAVLQVNSAS